MLNAAVDPPRSEKRKSMCPQCIECRAEPRTVAHANDTRTITYECPTCHQKWNVQDPSPRLDTI
jgi:hypothetical protein